MRRIKKFNELFDDEKMKSANEIDYLKGTLSKDIVTGEFGPEYWNKEKKMTKDALIEKLINKGIHQLLLFVLEPKIDCNGDDLAIKIWLYQEGKMIKNSKDPEGIFNMFGLKSSNFELILGIKIIDKNLFDAVITAKGEVNDAQMKRSLNFIQLMNFVKSTWVEKYLPEFENKEISNFGQSEYRLKQN